jgi:parallel beta-helix repeat protein
MNKSVTIVIVAALAVALSGVSAASAQVSCGAVITTNEVMTSDLACLFNSPAFKIDGGSVDMNGHRVACLPGQNGIGLINSGGKLKNGFVEGCDDGVILAGSGGHSVTNILVRGGIRGFVSSSAKNKFVRNTAMDNADQGFLAASLLQPMAHTFTDNVAANNGGDGFAITGDGNKMTGNIGYKNDEGFVVGGNGNKLAHNTAHDNDQTGFYVEGLDNSVSENTSIANGSWGFGVSGTSSVKGNLALANASNGFDHDLPITVSGNTSAFNSGSGFVMDGGNPDTYVYRNTAIGNTEDGIQTAMDNYMTVKANRVIANGAVGLNVFTGQSAYTFNFGVDNTTYDAEDYDGCSGTNTWDKNILHSTSDPCLD